MPNFNEIYSTERNPMDYGSGSAFTQDGGGLEVAVDRYKDGSAFTQDGGGLEVAVDQYEDGNAFTQDRGGLEVAVDRYEDGNAFTQDKGGLEVAVDRYEDGNAFVQDGGGLEVSVDKGDDFEFVQDGVRDWSDPMNKDVDDDVQINTDTQGQYETNPKQKKNKIFALLAGVAAAYFLLK